MSQLTPTTGTGRGIITDLEGEAGRWAAEAAEDELDTFTRLAAISRRDKLRDILRWLPAEIAEVELEAVRMDAEASARQLLEPVA